MITWASTKSPHVIDRPMDPRIVQHLRENHGIDSAILAADLHISEDRVKSYQRRLGLRAFALTGQPRRG